MERAERVKKAAAKVDQNAKECERESQRSQPRFPTKLNIAWQLADRSREALSPFSWI